MNGIAPVEPAVWSNAERSGTEVQARDPERSERVCPISLEPISRGIELRGRVFELSSIVHLVLASSPPQRPAQHPLHRTPLTDEELAHVFRLALADPECSAVLVESGLMSSASHRSLTREWSNDERSEGVGDAEDSSKGMLFPLALVIMVLVAMLVAALVNGMF
jgi:hypothetical protein